MRKLFLFLAILVLSFKLAYAVPPVMITSSDGSKIAGVTDGKLDVNASVTIAAVDQGSKGTEAWLVDGSAVTQPVSATNLDIRDLVSTSDSVEVKQATASNLKAEVSSTDLDIRDLTSVSDSVSAVQSGTWDIGSVTTLPAITGTVTANAGTNLNTSALALDATLAKLTVAQDADLGSNTQALIGGSVTTGYPTYTTGKIQPLSLATDGTLRVRNDMNPCSSTASGQKDVTTAGTDEVLGASTSILSVTVKAKPTNTGYIYVGAEGVSSTTGYILSKQETVTMDVDNLADVWIDSSVNGEGVSFIYVVK